MNSFARSALIGAATGCRTFTGVTALALTTDRDATEQPDRALTSSWVKGLLAMAALQEIVMDKLPNTPSRLEPLGLVLRIAAAAASGLVIARRHPVTMSLDAAHADPTSRFDATETAAHVVVATTACVGSSLLGERWRSWAASSIANDYVAAGLEDGVAIGAAALAALA